MSVYVGFKIGQAMEHKPCISEYYCGGCGWPALDHDSYCPECGGAFREEDATERTCKLRKTEWDNGYRTSDNICRTWGVVCSACGHPFEHESGECWNFCPSCGARVIEEE